MMRPQKAPKTKTKFTPLSKLNRGRYIGVPRGEMKPVRPAVKFVKK